jgi:hypothetical protein
MASTLSQGIRGTQRHFPIRKKIRDVQKQDNLNFIQKRKGLCRFRSCSNHYCRCISVVVVTVFVVSFFTVMFQYSSLGQDVLPVTEQTPRVDPFVTDNAATNITLSNTYVSCSVRPCRTTQVEQLQDPFLDRMLRYFIPMPSTFSTRALKDLGST